MGMKIEEEVVECFDSWGVPIGKFVPLEKVEQYKQEQVAAALEDVAKRIEAELPEQPWTGVDRMAMRQALRIVRTVAKEQDHG